MTQDQRIGDLTRLDPLDDQGTLRVVLESPQGSRNKLKYVPRDRAFKVSASLPAGMTFPFDFGFFPSTSAEDKDPLDVLVLMDAPAYPGVIVTVRLLGVIEAEQSDDGGEPYRNDRLIAVAEDSSERGDLHKLSDLDDQLLTQIETFFETYDRLTGKTFRSLARRGPRVARRLLDEARAT
ncbi:MAG: inorganic diphosphatase [Chloroflexota bacterium]